MKFRIVQRRVEGKYWFFPQRRKWFLWRTIKTKYTKIFCGDGAVQSRYTAECRIKDYIESYTNKPIIIKVV